MIAAPSQAQRPAPLFRGCSSLQKSHRSLHRNNDGSSSLHPPPECEAPRTSCLLSDSAHCGRIRGAVGSCGSRPAGTYEDDESNTTSTSSQPTQHGKEVREWELLLVIPSFVASLRWYLFCWLEEAKAGRKNPSVPKGTRCFSTTRMLRAGPSCFSLCACRCRFQPSLYPLLLCPARTRPYLAIPTLRCVHAPNRLLPRQ